MDERSTGRSPDRGRDTRRAFLRTATGLALLAVSGCTEYVSERVDGLGEDAPEDAAAEEPPERIGEYERAVHDRANEARRAHDVGSLAYSEAIAEVAREHSADMAERNYFAHESPGGDGPGDRLDEFFPGHCRGVGENIARVGRRPDEPPTEVAERIVSGWMDSPGHRENLLRGRFDEEGIGVAVDDQDRVFATQNFCETAGGDP